MVGCMLVGFFARFTKTDAEMDALGIFYWIEAIALGAFGIDWIVAVKVINVLTDDDQLLRLSLRRTTP